MAGSPKISVPVDLSPFVAVDAKVKALKAKQKDLDREMAKTARKGGAITPAMLKQSADTRRELDEAQSELSQKKSTDMALKIAEGRDRGEGRWGQFEKQVGWAMRANHLVRQAEHLAHVGHAFDDTVGGGGVLNGISAVAGLASHIPGVIGKVAKGVELATGFINDRYQTRKAETTSEQEYRHRQKYNDFITPTERYEHALSEKELSPFEGGDAGTRELGVSLGKLGFRGQKAEELRQRSRFRAQFHEGSMLDKMNYALGLRSAKIEAKLNAKIEGTFNSVRAEQRKAIALGNFDEFRQQEQKLHALAGMGNESWRGADEMWQQDIAASYARRNFARSMMMRAGLRTGQ